MLPDDLIALPLFADLAPNARELIAPLCERVAFAAADTLFAEGDRATTVYIVEAGEVAIRFRPYDGDWLTIATVRAGGVVGWSAALGRRCYTSSAVCLAPTAALALRGDRLRALARAAPDLGSLLLGRMALSISNQQNGFHDQVGRLINEQAGLSEGKKES